MISQESLKERLLKGDSMNSIARELGVGKTTIQNYRDRLNLTDEEKYKIREAELNQRRKKIQDRGMTIAGTFSLNQDKQELIKRIASLTKELESQKVKDFDSSVSSVYRGVAAELYAQYRLIRDGIEVIKAPHYFKAADLFVLKKNRTILKCEVKATSKGTNVQLTRTNYSSNTKDFKPRRYEKGEVDYFIVVLLEYEWVFVIPYEETVSKGKAISLSPNSSFWKFKDRFDLLKEA